MNNRPLRIGFIGAGANTRKMHIPCFKKIPGVECYAVCNRSFESSQQVATEFGIPNIANEWRQIIEDPEIDAVCIGTWPYMHAEVTIDALRTDKHVLTEARMAMNHGEAESMVQALRQRPKCVAQIVPAPFTLTYDAAIIHMINSGQIGTLREIRATHFFGDFADAQTPMTWRQNFELSGNNVMTLGILYEIVQRWLGNLDPEWIQANGAVFTQNRLWPETGHLVRSPLPEALSVVAGYREGFGLDIQISGVTVGHKVMEIIVSGSRGTLHYDLLAQKLSFAALGQAEPTEVNVPDHMKGGWNVEAEFVASIREGRPVTLTSFADGSRYMRFTDHVADSVAAGGVKRYWQT